MVDELDKVWLYRLSEMALDSDIITSPVLVELWSIKEWREKRMEYLNLKKQFDFISQRGKNNSSKIN